MLKFYKEFIFGIIEPIKIQISPFCHFCGQKREFDVILMDGTRLHVIAFCAFRNLISTSFKTHHSYAVFQNDVKFSFLIKKVTKS